LIQAANTRSNDPYLHACKAKGVAPHPARFVAEVPEFFIKFLTEPGDLVLDPFAGSNTVGATAEALGRRWVSIEREKEYVKGSKLRFAHAGR
jgi:DNA modification methylase